MHSYYSALFPLLAVTFLQGATPVTPVKSNSPHSPYTQLRVLSEKITSFEESLEKMNINGKLSDALLEENKKYTTRIEQLETENKNLNDQLKDLNEIYKKQTEDLLALSKDFQQFRSKEHENNTNVVKNRELASVKKDISQIKETLNTTQYEIGSIERRLVDSGTKTSQNFQEQLQKVKSELLEFCQSTNRKLQDFADQIKDNLMKVTHNGFIKHTIVSGESLASIARQYNTTPDQILSANHLQDVRGLHVGDTLLVPQEAF